MGSDNTRRKVSLPTVKLGKAYLPFWVLPPLLLSWAMSSFTTFSGDKDRRWVEII